MARRLNSYTSKAARAAGYRSGFEDKVADELTALGIKWTYEENYILYVKPVKNGVLFDGTNIEYRSDIYQECTYTPDFYLPDFDVFLETKGRFLSADRRKHELIKQQYPELDLRILFEYDGKATTKRRYSEWCDWKGIEYGIVPQKATKKREGIYLPEDWRKEFMK